MDWSKAKNILIVALLITNLILGGTYIKKESEKLDKINSATDAAISYIEKRGVKVECAVPRDVQDVSVLTLRFKDGGEGGLARTEYNGIPIEIIGLSSTDYIELIEKKAATIEILPAYNALLQSLGDITDYIDDVELIYLVDHTEYGGAGEDTAFPYWKLSTGGTSYYYAAFSE